MQTLIPFPTAQRIVLDHLRVLDTEVVGYCSALRRILGEPVVSGEMIPPFDNSAMDGFAVRARDAGVPGIELPITETVAAGGGFPAALPVGACARIMTGAPLPEGADAVIPVEEASVSGDRVRFGIAASTGDNVRRAGENVRAGDRILEAGVKITPPVIGMLATLGMVEVRVFKQPVVAVIATGDELVDAAATPGPSQIRDSNGPTLAAQVTLSGGILGHQLRVGDDRGRLRAALEKATASADVLLVSGGVSMGEFDYVQDELEAVGLDPLFWKVRQRPGKPLLFGLIGMLPVFGLPGNPVSASVCFEQYVRPALAAMGGESEVIPPAERAILDDDIDKKPGLHHFVRGTLRSDDDGLHVAATGPQGSHISRSLVLADCIIHLPEEQGRVERGAAVDVERLRWS